MAYRKIDRLYPIQSDGTRHMTQAELDAYGHAINFGIISIIDSNGVSTGTIYNANSDGAAPVLIANDETIAAVFASAGVSVTILSPTGSVNSSNVDFIFTQKPQFIISDGVTLRENTGWSWTAGTLTATMDIPPNYDLFGV